MMIEAPLDPVTLVVIGATLIALSGLPLLLLSRPSPAKKMALGLTLSGAAAGLAGSISSLLAGTNELITLAWTLPLGTWDLGIDPLSALFLIPVFLISGCAATYGWGYLPADTSGAAAKTGAIFSGFLGASMALLLLARNMVPFLILWEIMAVSAYFLLVGDHRTVEVRRAGIIYLVATHTGTLFLFVMFLLLKGGSPSFLFPSPQSLQISGVPAGMIFLASFIGFGIKAGIMPLHVWLPAAHANAPSHVSAMMSAVMLKMGIYGIIRTISFFAVIPEWWGWVLLFAGVTSAILGISFAVGQEDLKRLLAYSSIENIGIISLGLGASLLGLAYHNEPLFMLGMAGALFHVLNHSLFKALLFFAAGSVLHALGTRNLNRMGGLVRSMPLTATVSFTGLVALSGLPPLNGFASEYLLYLGFFDTVRSGTSTAVLYSALAAVSLALVGGLAVIVFVRLYNSAFSGLPRSAAAEHAHESPLSMIVPMVLLAALCLAAGIAPSFPVSLLAPAVTVWSPGLDVSKLAEAASQLRVISVAHLFLLVVAGLLLLALLRKARQSEKAETWGCGYLNPSPRIQYTASSFSEMIVKIFSGIIRPRFMHPRPAGLFPESAAFASKIPETQLEEVIFPFFGMVRERFSRLRRLQHGQLHFYIMYIFMILILLLLWSHLSDIPGGRP